jgi:hypothetical protein
MLDGGNRRLGREQLFVQKRFEQDSAHLSRSQNGYALL